MKKLILVDTFGFFFRSYYALPPLYNKDNFPTSLLNGFGTLITNLYKDFKDCLIIFTLEGGGQSKRKDFFQNYKANRHEAPIDLVKQIQVAIKWLELMDIAHVSISGYEADDCIASLVQRAKDDGFENVTIISHDKDLYQLINDETFIYDYAKKENITQKECFAKFGIYPCDFIMYQSIVGDSSDNVPGIKGIGAKGALKILEHYKSLEDLYGIKEKVQFVKNFDLFHCNFEEILESDIEDSHKTELENKLGKKMLELLIKGKKDAFLSRELVSLKKDLLNDFDFSKLQINDANMQNPLIRIEDELQKYELKKLLSKLDLSSKNAKFHFVSHLIDNENELFNILNDIDENCIIAFDCETSGLNKDDKIVGFSFCIDGVNGYYVPFLHNSFDRQISKDVAIRALKIILNHDIVGHNLKFDMGMLKANFNLMPQKMTLDSMILAWLLKKDSMRESLGLDHLMKAHFDYNMISFESVIKNYAHFGNVPLKEASIYASEDAVASLNLYNILLKNNQFDEVYNKKILDIAFTLEFKFPGVLADMESHGFKINKQYFLNLKSDFDQKLATLRKRIIDIAGVDFNINSPKQLGEFLFNTLKLKTTQKINSSKMASTDESVLKSLINEHEIIAPLLEYREFFKMSSTYIEPILKLKDKNDKIFASFLQTGTSTGRLSCKSPNLQNIPVKSEIGKRIREGFIADDGNILIGIDYSQIELRLLAHFSKDEILLDSFNNHLDIHLQSAKKIFKDEFLNLNDKNEIKRLRNIAKSINFGLIYGMGAKKLSVILEISQTEAKKYIDSYFSNFPTIKTFLKQKEEEILRNGFYETLLGRRRYFDFFGVSEFMRANFLREAINGIFQGSAADIIKLSMLQIYNEMKNVKMVVQVHDELIFEVKEDEAQDVGQKLLDIMQNIYALNVSLECNISYGYNWAKLK